MFRNSDLWEAEMERTDVDVVDVPAAALAADAGNVMVASMVMLGVLSTVTGLVSLDSLRSGVRACVRAGRCPYGARTVAGRRGSGLSWEAAMQKPMLGGASPVGLTDSE